MSKLQDKLKEVSPNFKQFTLANVGQEELTTKIKKMIGVSRKEFQGTMELLARSNPMGYLKQKQEDLSRIEDKSVELTEYVAEELSHLGISDDEAIHRGVAIVKTFRSAMLEAWESKYTIKNGALNNKINSIVKND